MVTMVWVVSRFRLKVFHLPASGQRSRVSWASQPQKSAALLPQPGRKLRKFIRTCGGTGGYFKRVGQQFIHEL